MGSLGLPEIIFILLLALLIFGPKRLPEIGRTLGKGIAEFRKASNELKRTINAELSLDADEQTPHPRRIESPVPSIMQAMAPPAAMTPETSETLTTPEVYSATEIAEAPVASVPWTPQAPPAGTIPQTSQASSIAPIVPIVTPAPAGSPDPLVEAHDPTLPSHTSHTDPIEPS